MKPITCVFFGRSGSGKGTQAELLIKKLKEIDSSTKTVYVETGDRFRKFVNDSGTYTAARVKEVMGAGGLMPAFVPIWTWTSLLIDELTGGEHLVFDGVSRRPDEAPILDSALQFYAREKPVILFLDVPVPEVTERLMKRGRHDDKEEKIAERLRWFETDVMKAVHYFETNPYYKFVNIDGDQAIEDVHKDILKALGI
jgi:adenylate kinase family enzyme